MTFIALPLAVAVPLFAGPTTLESIHSATVATTTTTSPQRTRVTVEVDSPKPQPPPPTPAPTPTPTYVPTAADRYAALAYDDKKSGKKLVLAGSLVAGFSYLFTSLGGALAIDRARDMVDDPLTPQDESRGARARRGYGRALLVPGIGPALAIARADRAMRAWAAGVAGLGQVVGVGLVALGAHRLARGRRYKRLSLAAMATPEHAQVTLGLRF